ncbi:DUF5719 family protein [Streptomyces sp. NPDC014894]|uniref:DUF5719 family protein n=1 Tax=Streptomyces sp. NPDC014894 TaxID=3364931 RepID=UPI003702679F
MKRTTISLLAAATALAAVTGFAAVTAPGGGSGATAAKSPVRLPVERSALVCPMAGSTDIADTRHTSYTPAGGGTAGEQGAAVLKPVIRSSVERAAEPGEDRAKEPGAEKRAITLKEPGKPVVAEEDGSEAPAFIGLATGGTAPGWTVQQTTAVTAGGGRGLLGLSCAAPRTEFWIPGASTAKGRQDYVHLTNPDDTPAVADVMLYGKNGELKTTLTEGVPVSAGSSLPILLSTVTTEASADVTVHVRTRSGRVGAAVRSTETETGSDWIAAAADPAGAAVLPGIPADATSVRLMVHAPGDRDADLKVELAGPSGRIVPLGGESLHVKAGMTTGLELKDVTKGEAGSLIVSPERAGRATPVVAALRVVRGKGDEQEVAFIPATGPLGERASVADNRSKGSTLSLTAPDAAARVKVTASAGEKGGEPVVKSYDIKAGTTLAVPAQVPSGLKGSYGLTVETESGGPVHGSRTLALPDDGVEMFTVQPLLDDRGTVEVPEAEADLSVLTD